METKERNDFLVKVLGQALALINSNVTDNVEDKDLQQTLITKNNDALVTVLEANFIKE